MRPTIIKLSALLVILLLSAPAQAGVSTQSDGKPLTINAAFADQTLSPQSQLELRLNRAASPTEGALAVLIGSTDVTSLVETTTTRLRYRPWPLPLPVGENKVTVYLISPSGEWRQIAQFTLRVAGDPASPQAQTPDQSPSATAEPTAQNAPGQAGFAIIPSLAIASKSQPGAWHSPTPAQPERGKFTDLTLQGSLRTNIERKSFGLQSQFDVVGSSYRPEALRYGILGDKAPKIDLASYLMQFKLGQTNFNAGQITYGSNRYLINSFASRGLSLSLPVNKHADFSMAAMNGSNIVGWSNLFGLDNRDHQVVSGKLGYEVFERRPGGLRLEATILSGSLLPLTSFNQNQINDAEKSRGAGFRVSATDKAQRLQLDAGFTRSHSVNTQDPLLDPSLSARGAQGETSDARYFDISYKLLQEAPLTENTKASLQVNFQHERVDPLFRSVAADTQANKFFNQIGLVANLGEVTAIYSHGRYNDNLDDIPSILKTMTRRHNLMVGLPMASLFGQRAMASQSSTQQSMWLPQLSFSYDRTHQFAVGVPINSDFKEPQIPNQIGANYLLTAEWQSQRWRYSYRLNYSAQDNLASNREDTKMRNLINGFTLGFNPHNAFDVNFDVSLERALNEDNNMNKDQRRSDRTLRLGFFANWRPTGRMTVTANFSNTGLRSFGDLSLASSNLNTQFDLQWSWRFLGKNREQEPAAKFLGKMQGQWYVRYAHRYARSRNELQKLYDLYRGNTLNTGLSFSFF